MRVSVWRPARPAVAGLTVRQRVHEPARPAPAGTRQPRRHPLQRRPVRGPRDYALERDAHVFTDDDHRAVADALRDRTIRVGTELVPDWRKWLQWLVWNLGRSEGLRPFEMAELSWPQVHFDRPAGAYPGLLEVYGKRQPRRTAADVALAPRVRFVPLFPAVYELLRQWHALQHAHFPASTHVLTRPWCGNRPFEPATACGAWCYQLMRDQSLLPRVRRPDGRQVPDWSAIDNCRRNGAKLVRDLMRPLFEQLGLHRAHLVPAGQPLAQTDRKGLVRNLRHTAITRCVEMCVQGGVAIADALRVAQTEIAGHASVETTEQNYAHLVTLAAVDRGPAGLLKDM